MRYVKQCMRVAIFSLTIAASVLAYAAGDTGDVGDAEVGRLLYQVRCVACHSVDFNGIGPAHRGVFGRLAGRAPGFDGYSQVLKSAGLIWTEKNLGLWLADPEKLIPGQKMGVNVSDEKERRDLIAYLKSISEKNNQPEGIKRRPGG